MKVWVRLLPLLIFCCDVGQAAPVFRFSLSSEPSALAPTHVNSSESNYLLNNVLRGLYVVDKDGTARPELAKKCTFLGGPPWQSTKVRCELKAGIKWSDGQIVRAADFVQSWQRLVQPGTKGIGAEVLRVISGAIAIHKGEAAPETLGVTAVSDRILEVSLQEPDSEFLQRLAHPVLAVARADSSYERDQAAKAAYSGPYRVTEWKAGGRIRLESNKYYDRKARPAVEVLVLDDDETAFNLYREGTLTFLRRLPIQYLKAWKNSSEFHQIPVARFDYLGFGPALRNETAFRQALSAALNYDELRIVYSALGTPGCPSISPKWMKTVPCLRFDLKQAQELWKTVPDELKNRRLALHFSKLGGEGVQVGMEWMQAQWKKHLGFNVELKPVEQQVYLSMLRTSPPDIFRKGVGLERATCLAAVEVFSKNDPENFIHLDRAEYESGLKKLREAKTEVSRKQACTDVVKMLIDRAEIIPQGEIHFSILAKTSFKGWILNPLNHLDLSHLQTVSKP